MSIIKMMTENTMYAGRKITSDTVDKEELKKWHNMLDKLHSEIYTNISNGFNSGDISNNQNIYACLKTIYDYIGTVNGGKLRNNESILPRLYTMGASTKIVKSMKYQEYERQLKDYKKKLEEYEALNGVDIYTINSIAYKIEQLENTLLELKKAPRQYYRDIKKTSATRFYKDFEDMIGDMVRGRMMMTDDEVKAEIEARKKARAEKQRAKRKAQANNKELVNS